MKHARNDYNRIQDPLGLIPEDEPVFLLRGQDVLAPDTLRFWAKQVREHGAHSDNPIADMAEAQASKMEDWQESVKNKFPDLPKE